MHPPRNFLLIILVLGAGGRDLYAQQDTVMLLDPVTVSALPLRESPAGEFVESPDLQAPIALQARSLADLLQRQNGLFIRHYGPGSLALPSIRGGSAQHCAVLWNGLPIQSPQLGVQDLSHLPLAAFDAVRIHYGSGGAIWGSGAVGGAIALETRMPAMENRWRGEIRSSAGSYGLNFQSGQLQMRNRALALVSRYYRGDVLNDYVYRPQKGLPERRQTHAFFRYQGAGLDGYWQPGNKHRLSLHVWMHDQFRRIPPTTVQTRSEATQADVQIRSMVQYRALFDRSQFQIKTGWFRESIDFRDPLSTPVARSGFRTWMTEAEWLRQIRHDLYLQAALSWQDVRPEAEAYDGDPVLRRGAAYLAVRWERPQWKAEMHLRQEHAETGWVPLQPGLGLTWQPQPHIRLRVRGGGHYRLPTANDLYWQPGGNENLKPESGWSVEGGWDLRPGKVEWRSTFYHRSIRDWILWRLPEGHVYWSAQNVQHVRSQGLEQRLTWEVTPYPVGIRLEGGYDYTASIHMTDLDNPTIRAGSQLLYTPAHTGLGRMTATWGRWTAEYAHRFIGSSPGINEQLPASQVGTAAVSASFAFAGWNLEVQAVADNCWNQHYRLAERRPMPGRWFTFSLLLSSPKS